MKTITIEELAYHLKGSKENNGAQPIFFLGAGASASGNIPIADEISRDILRKNANHPSVKKLHAEERTYAKLMSCFSPSQRKNLLKEYVDKAKINVTHIYLAQLLKNGFADYIFTVNFDDLMLKALALFNEFPPVYDMAVLKELTTTVFETKSIVYLHGQHHGLWLLNTQDEMEKVKNIIPRIFDSVKNNRMWIFIGYSGSDPIFEHIRNLGCFDDGLYWVGYKDFKPSKHVQDFLDKPNTNAFFIPGYDADSFMIKLNEALELEQPEIFDKPFSCLSSMLNNIVDINGEDHFKGVKERLEIAKRNVKSAVKQYEENKRATITRKQIEIDVLKKKMIDLLISEKYNYNEINEIESDVNETGNQELKNLLSELYNNWGTVLIGLAKMKKGTETENLYEESFDKYKKAAEIRPEDCDVYNNWGNALSRLAKLKEGAESDKLYQESSSRLQKAIQLGSSYYNLACYYALRREKNLAFKYLDDCLSKGKIYADFVQNDEDWNAYTEDAAFKSMMNKYKK